MNWFKNLSIAWKVSFAPVVAMLCLLALSLVAWLGNGSVTAALDTLTKERMPHMVQLGQVKQSVVSLYAHVNQSLAWEGAGFKEEKIKALDTQIAGEVKTLAAVLEKLAAQSDAAGKEKELLSQLQAEYAKYSGLVANALDIKSGSLGAAATYMTTMDQSFGRMDQMLSALGKLQNDEAAAKAEEAQGILSRNAGIFGLVLLLAALAASGVTWFAAGAIARPLKDAVALAQTMASGDFRVREAASYSDETGRVLAAMVEVGRNLGSLVGDIRQSADQVDTASSEIAQGNANLSSRTESTAAALEQTSASLKELSSKAHDSASYAQKANQLARQASEVADEGGRVVLEAVEIMDKINAQARKISEIIGVIDGIAFQTNILALNAAVEAARAGEQGRGFAVVAQEVRTLAQRSAEAAKEIRSLIGASVTQAELGTNKVQAAGSIMGRVVNSIRTVSDSVDEISRSSSEQALGFAQIDEAVTDMDQHTQQNAALVEQAAAAAESLKQQARRLAEVIATLKTT